MVGLNFFLWQMTFFIVLVAQVASNKMVPVIFVDIRNLRSPLPDLQFYFHGSTVCWGTAVIIEVFIQKHYLIPEGTVEMRPG